MDRVLTRLLGIGMATSVAVFAGGDAKANPQNGKVVGGSATITSTPGRTVIEQHSDKAIINWRDGFSIGAGEITEFRQPGTGSIALNRDLSGHRSDLFGALSANGNVWVINPNGVMIGPNAKINASGFLATTTDIGDGDFLAGRFRFDKPSSDPSAKVINAGEIRINDTGLAALVAPEVRNDGSIVATLGQVVLAGTETFTLDFQGDGLIQFALTGTVTDPAGPLVANAGSIRADGGHVLLAAAAATDVVGEVINMDGVVQARAVSRDGGDIVLDGGAVGVVRVAGLIDASANTDAGRGGTVKVLGNTVDLNAGTQVDVSGAAGGGTALIGGNRHGSGAEHTAAYTTVAEGATINADAGSSGNGGDVVVWSERGTRFAGRISARGGATGGNGGFAEVSGRRGLAFTGRADLTAPHGDTGTLLLDPNNIIIGGDGFTDFDHGSVIAASLIESLLNDAHVVVQTGSADPITTTPPIDDGVTADPGAAGDGDIYVEGTITAPANSNGLTLLANNDIVLSRNIDMQQSAGALALTAGADGQIVSNGGAIVPGTGRIDLDAGNRIFVELNNGVDVSGPINARSQNGDIIIGEQVAPAAGKTLTLGALSAEAGGIVVEVDRNIDVTGPIMSAPVHETTASGDVDKGQINLYASTSADLSGIGTLTIGGSIDGGEVNLRAPGDITGTGAIGAGRLAVTYGADTTQVQLNGDENRVDALAIGGAGSLDGPAVVFRNREARTPGNPLVIETIRARTVGLFAGNRVELNGPIIATGANIDLDGEIPGGRTVACPASSICLGTGGFTDNIREFGLDPRAGRFIVHSRNSGLESIRSYESGTRGHPTVVAAETDPTLLPADTNFFLYPAGDTLPSAILPLLQPPTSVPTGANVQVVEEPPALFVSYRPPVPTADSDELYAIDGNERLWR